MGYRWIGAILIVGSCTVCGFSIASAHRKEEHLLYQLIRILRMMESELRYRLTPLPDLCRTAADESKGIVHTVFKNLYHELSSQRLPDAGSCMAAALLKSGEIPAKIRRLFAQLGYTLGRFDLDGQLQGLQYVRKRCEELLESMRKNRNERLRSYQTLGICAGMALAIIMF